MDRETTAESDVEATASSGKGMKRDCSVSREAHRAGVNDLPQKADAEASGEGAAFRAGADVQATVCMNPTANGHVSPEPWPPRRLPRLRPAPPPLRVGGGTRGGVPGGGPERPGGLRAAAREHPPSRRPRADGRRLGEAARAHPRAAGDGGGRGDSPDSLVARAVAAVSATRRFRRSLSSRLSSSRALRANGRPEGRCDVCGPPDKPHRRHQGPATGRTLEPIVDRDRPCAETPVDGRRVSLFARSFICALTRH